MARDSISLVIPIGPDPVYKTYLDECLNSILPQMKDGDQLVLIDDQAHLTGAYVKQYAEQCPQWRLRWWATPWLSGCSHSWNFGVSLADNEWCILMGSDDKLLAGALDSCREIINSKECDNLGWYNFTCLDSEEQEYSWHNNAVMVSKSLWKKVGGFPITAALGAPDALVISIMLVHFPTHLHKIKEGIPLYWVRVHPDQDGRKFAGVFNQQVIDVRDVETQRWQKPTWTG